MERILISACLVGRPVRYDGTKKSHESAEVISRWQDEGRLVLLCPEVAVGFPTPRPPAEIIGENDDSDGEMVLSGNRKPGMGTTTAALRKAGFRVWPETSIVELDSLLKE
ncbi:DUF523 domain-containing protein [Sagittula sp. NFXS13]|uniref:DUF523 domain-containing protein n=1 Tax=Sagittula sp. NFXS13 TaxID=2819095 RepID=UPI0032DF2081